MRKNMQVNCPQQSLQARNIGGGGHFLSLENYLQNYKVLGLTHLTLRPLPSPLKDWRMFIHVSWLWDKSGTPTFKYDATCLSLLIKLRHFTELGNVYRLYNISAYFDHKFTSIYPLCASSVLSC